MSGIEKGNFSEHDLTSEEFQERLKGDEKEIGISTKEKIVKSGVGKILVDIINNEKVAWSPRSLGIKNENPGIEVVDCDFEVKIKEDDAKKYMTIEVIAPDVVFNEDGNATKGNQTVRHEHVYQDGKILFHDVELSDDQKG